MKKNILWIPCLMLGIFFMAINVYADNQRYTNSEDEDTVQVDEISYSNTPLNKLERGIINGATFWAEVPAKVFKVSKEQDPVLGLTLGTVEGTFNGILRGLTAIFDVVTCIIPPYNKPLMEPGYALTSADRALEDDF